MEAFMTGKPWWRRSAAWLGRAGVRAVAFAIGFMLMIWGLAMGVSMVLLPVGLVVGLSGVLVAVWAVFGDVPGTSVS
jgi:hypothetical protein